MNLIDACIDKGVKRLVALSTDKASSPVNLYGATKLCSDKIFIAGNSYSGGRTKLAVVRYGNVMGSRGSVIPFFMETAKSGKLTITDKRMTRFMITLEQGVELVWHAFDDMEGGEIYVKKIPSMNICDIATAVDPTAEQVEIGIRPGEKLHEEMITVTDALDTIDLGKYYVIMPSVSDRYTHEDFIKHHNAKPVPDGFYYASNNNTEWETVESMRENIKKFVDPNFVVK
jgi:FlaA1/EpsC-like NDP-sugar epimerase